MLVERGHPRLLAKIALDGSVVGAEFVDKAARALGNYAGNQGPWLMGLGKSLHYQGTIRMGEHDDGTNVCNANSQVWGFDNLFVGGNGVIPGATACPPTLTSVALAAYAMDKVVDALG